MSTFGSKRFCAVFIVFFLSPSLGAPSVAFHRHPPSPRGLEQREEVHFRPAFPAMGMVALEDDQLLLWHGDGRAQLRMTNGQSSEVFHLPVQAIMDIKPDGTGFLVTGSPTLGASVVLRMTARGEELDRWRMNEHEFRTLLVDSHGRRVVTRLGMLPLFPGGKLGPLEPFPNLAQGSSTRSPTILTQDEVQVIWFVPDLSKEHQSNGSCERLGPNGWKFEVNFLAPPVMCGEWLVVLERFGNSGLTVRSLSSGAIRSRITHHSESAIAYGGSNRLVVGDRQLSLLKLPEGKTVWTRPISGTRITSLAIMKSFIAYQVRDSSDIFLSRISP